MIKTRTFLLSVLSAAMLMSPSHSAPQKKQSGRYVPFIPEVKKADLICFALYTVHDKTLKLTAQLYPLADGAPRTVRLEVQKDGRWTEVARTQVIEKGWTAPFRVENWDDTRTTPYRVLYHSSSSYQGTIRKNPKDKAEIVVAGFTGNSSHPKNGGDLSRQDLVENVKKIDADLLFFSGDQVYDHYNHYAEWLKFGRDFGDIIKDRPTLCLPDDHDAGQPNLWGESGKISTIEGAADGGYKQPGEYVKEVERAQTSHFPDPIDPGEIGQGIGVWFTNLNWGNIDFAIIEDRKFKTGPAGRVPKQGPRPDHIRNPNYDPASVDIDGAVLLGERQLNFLDDWTQKWQNANMKVVLSATIFCGGAHVHGNANGRLHADMDSNGWPQTGRNQALKTLRKGFAFHFAGDQHLATIFKQGVDEYRDSIWSFCVPSIANVYLRWWDPLTPGENKPVGFPDYTGDHLDGFGNKVTNYAAANPIKSPSADPLTKRAAGFGVIRLNTRSRDITMECWPRNVDVSSATAQQYDGWPQTISQFDNYSPLSWGELGSLTFDIENPVIQLIDEESKEILYTLRITGNNYTPRAPHGKSYMILAGVDNPNTVISKSSKVGSRPLNVKLN